MISSVYQVKLFRGLYDGTQVTAPTVTDDSSKGFYAGYRLLVKEDGLDYVCQDASVGAAVWTTSNVYDERIKDALKAVSGLVMRYCGKLFIGDEPDYMPAASVIYGDDTYYNASGLFNAILVPGDSIVIMGSKRNDGIYQVKSVESDTAFTITTTFPLPVPDLKAQVLVVQPWPFDLQLIGARMAEYDAFRRNQDVGLAGQSVGTYSMSKETVDILGHGYPASVVAGIMGHKRPRIAMGLGFSFMGYRW